MSALKDKAVENAKRIEERQACEPAEDYLVRFARAFEGPSNSGIASVHGARRMAPPTATDRLLNVIARAAERDARERARKPADNLSPADRKRIAADYREAAERLMRG